MDSTNFFSLVYRCDAANLQKIFKRKSGLFELLFSFQKQIFTNWDIDHLLLILQHTHLLYDIIIVNSQEMFEVFSHAQISGNKSECGAVCLRRSKQNSPGLSTSQKWARRRTRYFMTFSSSPFPRGHCGTISRRNLTSWQHVKQILRHLFSNTWYDTWTQKMEQDSNGCLAHFSETRDGAERRILYQLSTAHLRKNWASRHIVVSCGKIEDLVSFELQESLHLAKFEKLKTLNSVFVFTYVEQWHRKREGV